MPGVFKIKNVEDAEFKLTHPDGAGAVSIDSNNIAKIDVVNAALELKANTADLKEIGVGQTWQDVTASRILGTTYTNSTGKPIVVCAGTHTGVGVYQLTLTATINGIDVKIGQSSSTSGNTSSSGSIIVPNGGTYNLTSGYTLTYWFELR